MTDLRYIAPKRNGRMIAVGKTGTGKTTLALALYPLYKHVLIVDPIHVLRERLPKEYRLCTSPHDLAAWGRRKEKLLYQPDPEFMNWQSYDLVYHWAFERGDTMIGTDEALRVMRPSGQAPPYMEACFTAGRQRGVGMIVCTQRPTKVDLRVLTEAECYACFRLKFIDDRERMAKLMEDERVLRPATGHNFWFTRDGEKLDYFLLEED